MLDHRTHKARGFLCREQQLGSIMKPRKSSKSLQPILGNQCKPFLIRRLRSTHYGTHPILFGESRQIGNHLNNSRGTTSSGNPKHGVGPTTCECPLLLQRKLSPRVTVSNQTVWSYAILHYFPFSRCNIKRILSAITSGMIGPPP